MGGGKHRMRNVPLAERFNSRNLDDGVPRNHRFSFVPRNQTSAPRINPVGNENQDLNTNYHNMNNVPRNRGFNLGRNLDDMYMNGPPQNMIFG
ncbi:hypothetical protein RchiOBHm_Chr1g0354481 [Rosa chinensis]|uniref:Uncharacterized protein n=1 Tax=Rosa chinensis TaxID=74649 RepID=A0A2P6SH43_ROSCH|nr:hypothetical protein RchiOBHm_Chr1g0354481 [Rosa chinensis]